MLLSILGPTKKYIRFWTDIQELERVSQWDGTKINKN